MTHLALGAGAEFDLVRAFLERLGAGARGIGGDCAIVDLPPGEQLIVSTDTSVEGVHFRAAWLTPREIGYRAAMSAWSDLAAAAATPIGALLAVTAPRQWAASLADLVDGVGEAGRAVGAPIVGGDTTSGPALVITMSVLGAATRATTRAGARPGDRVYVTGTLGGPRSAVAAWDRGGAPDPALRLRFARPEPRLREARWLAAGGMSAAVDVSDGLIADLGHVAAASAVRLVIDLDRIPRWPGATAVEAGTSGEEYELAFTAPGTIDATAFGREFAIPVTPIGRVEAGAPEVAVLHEGRRVDPLPGYDHFSP